MMSDKAWLEAMRIAPWDADAPAFPTDRTAAHLADNRPAGERDAEEAWFSVSVDIDECGVAHLAESDLRHILATNKKLGFAADNWCRRAHKAERLVKATAYVALGCAIGVVGWLIYTVVSRWAA